MRVQEQIYTSAPRLLEGGGNLGVVAQSREFPRALSPALESSRAYTLLPRYDLADPGSHPPRLVCGPAADGATYVLTRTVFAGADHTGRTTPLTHHIAVPLADARATYDGVGAFLTGVWPMLASAWTDAPQWIEPAREAARSNEPVASPSLAWRTILPWLADAMIHFPRTGRSAVVVVDPDDAGEVPAGLAAALSLLPSSIQWRLTLATHVIGMSDFVREAAVLVTYADSPFLDQCRSRRDSRAPLILDLAAGEPSMPAGPWGTLLQRDGSHDFHRSRKLAQQFDRLELEPDDISLFIAAANVVAELTAAPTEAASDDWRALGACLNAGNEDAAVADWIGQTATAAVRALAADENSASRWDTLASIVTDLQWLIMARTAAMDAVLSDGNAALNAIADMAAKSPAAFQAAMPLIRQRLAVFPVVRERLLADAPVDQTTAARLAAFLPAVSLTSAEGRRLVGVAMAAPVAVRRVIERPLLLSLAASIRHPADIIQLGADHRDAARAFVIPLLAQALDRIQDTTWNETASSYRDTAISAGLIEQDYASLFERHGRSLRKEELDAWRADPRLTADQRRHVELAAVRAGLVQPEPSYSMPQAAPVPVGGVKVQDRAAMQRRSAIRGGVGPVVLLRSISLLVVATCLISYWVSHGWGRARPVDRLMLIAAAATVVGWLMSEVLLRVFVRSPQQLGIARGVRWLLVAVLILGFIAALWPALSRLAGGHAVGPSRVTGRLAIEGR